MNAPIADFSGSTMPSDARMLKRVAGGIAVSVLLHALLLSIHRQPQPAASPAPVPAPLTLRLQPLAPPAPPPVPEAPAIARAKLPPATPAPARRSRPVIAVSPDARQSTEDAHAVAPPPATPQDDTAPSTAPAPRFDMDAARGVARKVANEPDPAKAGIPLERLPPKPLETESKLARGIQAAKRGNCKDGVPGGLLAPILLLMEKKDSGCKW